MTSPGSMRRTSSQASRPSVRAISHRFCTMDSAFTRPIPAVPGTTWEMTGAETRAKPSPLRPWTRPPPATAIATNTIVPVSIRPLAPIPSRRA